MVVVLVLTDVWFFSQALTLRTDPIGEQEHGQELVSPAVTLVAIVGLSSTSPCFSCT